MLRIDARDVMHLRGFGGERCTAFVDDLIRAEAAGRLSDSEIRTNRRGSIGDEGVDTEVCKRIADEPTGRFGVPTVWQHKGGDARNVGNAEELIRDGTYCERCIERGYAYRLSMCDELTAAQKSGREEDLRRRVRAIRPDAPDPIVVTAGDLAEWANRHLGVVRRYFYPHGPAGLVGRDAWRGKVADVTEVFVPVEAWRPIWRRIEEHVDFTSMPPSVVLPVSGVAGVGKTRLVYEAVCSVASAASSVLYTSDDEDALKFANHCASDERLTGVLVVDECTDWVRSRLEDVLNHRRERVRVITIGSAGDGYDDIRPVNRLAPLPLQTVEAILAANWGGTVPEQRRRRYAELAGGYVKLAAVLCRYDTRVVGIEAGLPEDALNTIDGYLRGLVLDPEDQKVMEATALLPKVGSRGEVGEELEQLCALVKMDPDVFKDRANRLHDRPGFMGRGGRFYYVTPKIVADVAFERAWRRWAAEEPQAFLQRIPGSLQQQFLDRVRTSAPRHVREAVGGFFASWAESVQVKHLARLDDVKRLVALVESEPKRYLPMLRTLVERCSEEELEAIGGQSVGGGWGLRGQLVSVLEGLAAFPEHFADAEAILLRLAVAESEPGITNNATGTWQHLFCIGLSGTAAPFPERLSLLQRRIWSDNAQVSSLALDALEPLLETHHMRIAGASAVGGKAVPPEWRPRTDREFKDCIDAVVDALLRISRDPTPDKRRRAQSIAMKHLWNLTRWGYLERAREIFREEELDDDMRTRLITSLDAFGDLSERRKPEREQVLAEVQEWLERLHPRDFHGRLAVLVRPTPFRYLGRNKEEKWRQELARLASECLQEPALIQRELEWLSSEQAQSAVAFGEALGRQDSAGVLLDIVFEAALRYRGSALARGYTLGLVGAPPQQADAVNAWIDKLERTWPEGAYEVFMMGGEATKAVERALRLVDAHRLPAARLGGFCFGGTRHGLSVAEVESIASRLADAAEAGDKGAKRAAVDFIGFRLHDEKNMGLTPMLEAPGVRRTVWRVVETTAQDGAGESYQWAELVKSLVEEDPARAAAAAVIGLMSDTVNIHHEGYCERLLVDIAQNQPEAVMESVGTAMLDRDRGWRLQMTVHRNVIASLPEEAVINWVREHGLEGVRQIAHHLPIPYVDAVKGAVVPRLTEFVLEEFADDDRTFSSFCAGVHDLQMYGGDIAAQHEEEAAVAERFLNHRLRRIREWARYEVDSSREQARQWREREEEFRLE